MSEKKGFLGKLISGLSKTRDNLKLGIVLFSVVFLKLMKIFMKN